MPVPNAPLLTVDCVLFDNQRRVLLIKRKNAPYRGCLALPGGFVEVGEQTEDACRRELLEETGLKVGELRLLDVYSDSARDPRGHTCSIAYAGISPARDVRGGDDAADAEWIADWRERELAFDHREIIEDAERLLFAGQEH